MFNADIKHFKTVQEYKDYVATITKPSWVKGVVIHHTWKPVQGDWKGETTMNALKKYYENLHWDAGPHLFLCIGSPNSENDGIWQMTPLTGVGVHAGECNSTTWGMEIVGNYDLQPWSAELKEAVYDTLEVLLEKIGVKSVVKDTLRGHRECNSPKTCPGKMIDMEVVRSDMQTRLFPNTNMVDRNSAIINSSRCTPEEALSYLKGHNGWYTPNELKNIVIPAYYQFGSVSGVDPCIAIAQLIHETGFLTSWWSNRPRRNPAGIGVTGQSSAVAPAPEDAKNWAYNSQTQQWYKGLSFATWDKDAVPAHVARLLGYAVPVSSMTDAQRAFVFKYTHERPLPASVLGVAPTLAGLEGTWAVPGKGYADKLALHANGIIRS
jgi:N-acetylmuramoyl-L-alanine amidase/Mannosyl-glycoprotein endo-beta-N-acetylglucosaminidase